MNEINNRQMELSRLQVLLQQEQQRQQQMPMGMGMGTGAGYVVWLFLIYCFPYINLLMSYCLLQINYCRPMMMSGMHGAMHGAMHGMTSSRQSVNANVGMPALGGAMGMGMG